MGLPILQDGRKRRNLKIMYKIVHYIEKTDRQNLELLKDEIRQIRGHSKKIGKSWYLRDIKKYVEFSI